MNENRTNQHVTKSQLSFMLDGETVAQPEKDIGIKDGDLCPHCEAARLDYDGLLNLYCPDCGYTLAGCFT